VGQNGRHVTTIHWVWIKEREKFQRETSKNRISVSQNGVVSVKRASMRKFWPPVPRSAEVSAMTQHAKKRGFLPSKCVYRNPIVGEKYVGEEIGLLDH
jgi:hypothetical protein